MHSSLPKVLQPIAGRPMLAHVLDAARGIAPDAIRIVYGHGGEQLRAAFPESDLSWHLQAEQLGTGHAVAAALPEVPDDHRVVIVCGDTPLLGAGDLASLAQAAPRGALCLLTARLPDPAGYGRVLRNAAGDVVGIVEDKDANEAQRSIDEINTGLIAASAADLRAWLARVDNDNAQGEYYLTDVITMAFEAGRAVQAVPLADPAAGIGINDKLQLAAAERRMQSKRAEALMRHGVTLADPARIDLRGEIEAGKDVFIDVNVILEGRVVLGDGVSIGPNCAISDSTLGDHCRVHANTVMQNAVADAECEIGPFARLRPGTELSKRVKVGNFVEIKNSRIADNSKVNHLSYIGDATIGTDVNVGAGTITCNYDGASKHRTIIGDQAFIGSGSMLVAPVEIGAGATIGAGSTISKDTPPGELTLTRAKQQTVPGWRRPVKGSS